MTFHTPLTQVRSISTKLRIIILSICGSMLLLSSVTGTLFEMYRGRQELQQKIRTMTEIVANQSSAALAFRDAEAAGENLASLQAVPEVLGATLQLANGRELATYRRLPGQPLPAREGRDTDGVYWGDDELISVMTVASGGQTVGRLVVLVSLGPLHRETATSVVLSFTLLLVVMGVATLLALWLQRSITRPVEELAAGMQQVTRTGDYSIRIEPQSADEMGRLTTGFNAMLSCIAEQAKALEQHQEELEGLVAQRTQELQASMERVHHLAFFDGLTGLANRMLFHERASLTLAHARHRQDHFAILFLDLDRFKRINDSFGHHIGDLLLKEVSQRLRYCVRNSDLVGLKGEETPEHVISRQGGDEFTILLSDIQAPEDAARAARRIIEVITRPLRLEGFEMVTTTSIGIAVFPEDGDSVAALLKNADAAMYHAKMEGRNNFQFFRDAMHESSMRRLEVETELRQALARQQFTVHFQPQVDLDARKIYGAEALLRWHHPRLGEVTPSEFIPVAEECDLIGPITGYVLAEAGQCLARWRAQGLPPVRVSVNVSGARFGQQRLIEMTRQTIREYGLAPRQLVVELTENWLMQNRDDTLEILLALKREGVGIAIDDFGTGYSSLAYLKAFPIHTLKIDKSFVDEVTTDANDAAITRAIVAMAQSLDLEVIAEGVETGEQRDYLQRLGCHRLQGYLFGRPMPAAAFEELLRRGFAAERHLSPFACIDQTPPLTAGGVPA